MYGTLGLGSNVNTRESAMQELGVLERMSQRVEQDKAKDAQAQAVQQQAFQQVYQESRGMLEKDRNLINKKAKIIEEQVRNQMSNYGGSESDFLSNGGLSFISKMKNGILESEEAQRFRSNAENLARIRMAQEKGLGHLISPTDMKSLEEYEKNEDGSAITYSGLMAEVEIPPSNLFDYGTEIPVEKIVSHKSNMMKIRGNYAIAYPNKPEPTWEELVTFAKRQGYGGLGSNTARINAQTKEAAARAKYDKESDTSKKSWLNNYNTFLSQVSPDLNVSMINEQYGGSFIENMKKNNPQARQLIGEKFMELSKDSDWIDDEWLGLKEGYRVFPGQETKIVQAELGESFDIKDGKVLNFAPDSTMYREDGVKVSGQNAIDPEDYRGNYEVLGVTTALKSHMDSDGTDALLMDRYESNGKIDEKSQAKQDAGYTNKAKLTTVIALRDEDGEIFYKEVDTTNALKQTQLSGAMPDDNITETVELQKQSQQLINQVEQMETEQQIQFEGAHNMLQQSVFNNSDFKFQAEDYWGANSGGDLNRNEMMKAYYMAFDSLNEGGIVDRERVSHYVQNDAFGTSMELGKVKEDMKRYGQESKSDDELIATWLENMNEDLEEGTIGWKRNVQIAQKWKQILGLIQ